MMDGTDGDVGGDMASEEAAWRELIAQFELPAATDAATAPWPERENLGKPAGEQAAQQAGQAAAGDPVAPGQPEPAGESPGPAADSEAAQPEAASPGTVTPGTGGDADGRQVPGVSGDRTRVVRPVNPVWRPATDAAEDDDDRYIPPPPPPLPQLDPVAKGAWAALFGGPAYLLLATFRDWQVSGWAALAAVAAFVGGFVVLVIRMGDGPSRGDGPDSGAVV